MPSRTPVALSGHPRAPPHAPEGKDDGEDDAEDDNCPGPERHCIRVAHSCTLAIRCRNCPAVASALGGPPHTRRTSV
ncbi:hypothetical protein SGFS_048580 [Streptomyces graminofaciens]|uniref:Uncharacterized protein n=1 Tax=Streptomyces graminofaciens TaxID=68212 RepID=A0ABN5VK07_9ACTN|nr:hypothetical protein SGFS_048580 [Streptomyces graminofaciens]